MLREHRVRRPPLSRAVRHRLWIGAGVVTVAIVALWPASTRSGHDFQVRQERVPLVAKAYAFLRRDRQLASLSREVLDGIEGDEAKALAAFEWTIRRIGPQLRDSAIVDDHIFSVIERGYGASDQQADVFTTLLAYADVPAFWRLIGRGSARIPISFVMVDGNWRVFDVARGIQFRDEHGLLVSVAELAARPELVHAAAEQRGLNADVYIRFFEGFAPPPVPQPLRAELQMPIPRLRHEARKILHR